jgi:prepilin-type N-terminal cleavage/methylation domain-containing protein
LNFLLIERNASSATGPIPGATGQILEGYSMSRPPTIKGFTLIEVMVAVGIVLLLLAALTPFYANYRGKSNVNRAVEVTKAVIERAAEEAKSAGYPLPQDMLTNGLDTAAVAPLENQTVVLKIRKRTTLGGEAKLIAERHLPRSESLKLTLGGLGLLTLADTDAQGVFLEVLQKSEGSETLLATLPIDVNGEFVFQGDQSGALISFGYGDHVRGLQMNTRGVVVSDQR